MKTLTTSRLPYTAKLEVGDKERVMTGIGSEGDERIKVCRAPWGEGAKAGVLHAQREVCRVP